MKIKAFSQEGGGILWVISGIALASCGGGGGGGSSSGGGRSQTPTSPVSFTPLTASALMADENDNTWTLRVTATSEDSDSDGTDSVISGYEILQVRDADGMVVASNGGFSITNAGVISISGALNYEDSAFYTLNIQATDTPESGVSGHDEADTGTIPLTVTVQNLEEGDATYEIMQSTTTLAENTVLTARLLDGLDANDDPDGVEAGSIRYQWFADGVEIVGATSASYTIGSTVAAVYDVRITYLDGYNAGLDANDPARTTTTAIATTSPIKLMQDGSPTLSYTASVDEDAIRGASVVTIDASVEEPAQGSTIRYEIVLPGGVTSNADEGSFFQISSSGEITVFGLGTLDYETTPSHELTVRVTYDSNGNTNAGGDIHTRDVQVVIDVNDVAGQSPAIIPDRQSFAHQDSYDPDELGLTPMPDADPSAG